MFAYSSALSALEHAIYDVWVVDCLTDEEIAEEEAGEDEPADAMTPPRRRPE